MKKLPKTLYVSVAEAGTPNEYLEVTDDNKPHNHVESGQVARVGVYELVGYRQLDATVNIGDLKPLKGKR